MNMDFDINKIFQDNLASSMGLDKYQYIIDNVRKTDVSVDTDFQRVFNGFYVVRRNESWRKVYYELFEHVKSGNPTFESILTHMYDCTGNVEPSFSSKMLATVFPEKPIWDQYVVQNLNMKLVGKSKQERLENAVALYADIEKWYWYFLLTDKAKECVEVFDRMLPNYKHISCIKKIDSILWSIR